MPLDMQTLENPPQTTVRRPRPVESKQPQPRFGRWILVTLALVVVALIAGIIPRLHARHQLAAEMRDLAITTVNVVSPATEQPTSLLTLPAEIKAQMEAPIFARANGYLKGFNVD